MQNGGAKLESNSTMKWTESSLGSALHGADGTLLAKLRPLAAGGVSAQWCNGMLWDVSDQLSKVQEQASRLFKTVPEAKRAVEAALAGTGEVLAMESDATPLARPRYKDAQKQKFFQALIDQAADLKSEMYHLGRPHRGAGHRTAFWDGYAGIKRTANVIPGTLSAVAYAAGKQFAKSNPGIPREEAVWTPGVTRQGEPTKAD